MVAILEMEPIAGNVHQRDARLETRVWIRLIHQGVSTPISHHHRDAHHNHGQNEIEKGCAQIMLPINAGLATSEMNDLMARPT